MTIPQYELKDFWVEPEKLLLCPNNPRLKISSFDDLKYSPEELCSNDVQDKLWDLMRKEEHNVSEIIDSIESQGYTNLNSIIIKRVGNTEKFIVLEGNRRTTAIRHWLKNRDELSDEISKTLNLQNSLKQIFFIILSLILLQFIDYDINSADLIEYREIHILIFLILVLFKH